jgi:hypothetical protein
MVRRNELACRDGWDRNLWEAAGQDDTPPDHGPRRIAVEPPGSPPLAPGAAAMNRLAPVGEDVLLSEARIVSDGPGTWEPPTRPFASAGFDPRTAIFRAREAYRERARVKAAAARQATAAEALAAADVAPAAANAASEQAAIGVLPGVVETERVEAVAPEPLARIEAGSHLEATAWSANSRASGDAREPVAVASVAEGPGGMTTAPPAPMAAGARVMAHSGYDEAPRPSSHVAGDTAQALPVDPPDAIADSGEREPAASRTDLPQWFRTDLPRICRSCRDYRPAADGQRGWCANAWAFTHSRLVNADEGTPCQSAIGDWWVPVDDVWLVAADVSAHGRATPLLDRLVAAEVAKRRRS